MRVVVVSDFGATNGGAARVAISSAVGLAEAGVPVEFVCAVQPISERLDHPLIRVHCLDMPDIWARSAISGAIAGIWNREARQKLGAVLDGCDARSTIVHIHQWTKAFSPSVLGLAQQRGMAMAVTLHDYFAFCPNGAYYDYHHAVPCTVTPLSVSCISCACDSRSRAHKVVRLARQVPTKLALGHATHKTTFIHVTRFAQSIGARFLPAGAHHVVVPNPIDVKNQGPAPVAENDYFLLVGRLTVEKGVLVLAEAARRANLPVVFAGTGPMEAEIAEINPDAKLLGWLSEQEVGTVLRRARALVFPSLWLETGGLVVAEALANGVPVIASPRSGAADLVVHEENGLFAAPADPDRLATAMTKLNDAGLAQRMGKNAFARYWAEPWNLDRHVDGLLHLYRGMLEAEAA